MDETEVRRGGVRLFFYYNYFTMEFWDQYNHPKWQEKKSKIMKRDKFKCRMCECDDQLLHVHHRYYKRGHKVWEYGDYCFITLCKGCHDYMHMVQDEFNLKMSKVDPLHLECLAKSDMRKLARLLFNGELDAVKKYIKTLRHNG